MGSQSPGTYRRQENRPDANFYKRCLPNEWRTYQPQFFNCKGRAEVFKCYNHLLEFHENRPDISYLNPNKLLALVDADLRPEPTSTACPHPNTEAAREACLETPLIVSSALRTWVTPFVHKEAFFFRPAGLRVLSTATVQPYFFDRPFDIGDFRCKATKRLDPSDPGHLEDTTKNIRTIQRRLRGTRFENLSLEELHEAFTEAVQAASNETASDQISILTDQLLTIAKVKSLWSSIKPDPNSGWNRPPDVYRNQLTLAIAKAISRSSPDEHPISALFAYLQEHNDVLST